MKIFRADDLSVTDIDFVAKTLTFSWTSSGTIRRRPPPKTTSGLGENAGTATIVVSGSANGSVWHRTEELTPGCSFATGYSIQFRNKNAATPNVKLAKTAGYINDKTFRLSPLTSCINLSARKRIRQRDDLMAKVWPPTIVCSRCYDSHRSLTVCWR